MALINFIFGNRTASGFALSGVVEFQADLTMREMHERTSEVTDHPVETGGTISDHVIINPETVLLEGFVTDRPAAIFSNANGKTQDAFDVLDEAWRSREPIQISTGRRVYTDMVITRLSLPRETPSSMAFTLEAKKIRTAGAEFVFLPPEPAPDVAEQAGEEADEGRQTADPAQEEIADQYESILSGIGSWLGRSLGGA